MNRRATNRIADRHFQKSNGSRSMSGFAADADKFLVGMTKVENELGQLVIALIRIRMHGLLQRPVDPCRELAAVAQGGFVS